MDLTTGIKTATIAASGTTSSSVEITGCKKAAIAMSDLTTDTYVTVQVSHDNSTWEELWDRSLGTPADVTLVKSKNHVLDIAGWDFIRFVADSAQASAREIKVRGI